MKFHLLSDCHIEFYNYNSEPNHSRQFNSFTILPKMDDEKDHVLLLPGDICMIDVVENYRGFFQELSDRFKLVLWTPGNHEHYRGDFKQTVHNMKLFVRQFGNIHVLNNDYYSLGDVEVIGTTLWTDFNHADPFSMQYAKGAMTDFAGGIHYGTDDGYTTWWTPELSVVEHGIARRFIEERLFINRGKKKTIVMTHHLPSEECVSAQYKNSMLNAAFYANCDDLIIKYEPNYFIHGHSHDNLDIMIGKTRVIRNPLGYNGLKHEENSRFLDKFVIEV